MKTFATQYAVSSYLRVKDHLAGSPNRPDLPIVLAPIAELEILWGIPMATQDDIYLAKPTREEIDDVLTQRLTATVATLNPDDSIHLAYVIFLYEDDKLYWETASSTRKIKNLVLASATSFLLQGQAASGTNLMVSGAGTATVLSGAEANTINQRLRAKYITPEALPTINQVWGEFDDVCVEVTIDKWRSWTNRAFGEATQAAFGDDPPESIWISD